jgi:hypothetical protein
MAESNPYARKRRFQRRKVDFPVGVLHAGNFEFETGVEIGEGENQKPPRSRRLDRGLFFLPNGDFVLTLGEVIYILNSEEQGAFAGVRFLGASDRARGFIRRYVESSMR